MLHQVLILNPNLRNIQAIGTDGEQALVNAFPNSIFLRCIKHFTDNIITKLRDLNFDAATMQEIIADIVGVESADERQLGLVDAVDSLDFDVKLASLEMRWNKLEVEGRKVIQGVRIEPEFYCWFIGEKSEVVCKSMIQSVRIAARLGNPPEKFYTNASESMNNILKLKVYRKAQSLPTFVDSMYELVSSYEKNLERAICRRGDWRLIDVISHPEGISKSSKQKLMSMILEASCSISTLLDKNSKQPCSSSSVSGAPCSAINMTELSLSLKLLKNEEVCSILDRMRQMVPDPIVRMLPAEVIYI
jgi:hypothetical protein